MSMSPEYHRATLFVLSGTGNTHRLAQWMKDDLQSQGITVTIHTVQAALADPALTHIPACDKLTADSGGRHLVGLLSPAHAFTTAWPMLRLIRRLKIVEPELSETAPESIKRFKPDVFIAETRAGSKIAGVRLPGMEGSGCLLQAVWMRCKGWTVRGWRAFDMPSNWLAVHPGFSESASRDIIDHARPKIRQYIERITAGERSGGSWICPTIWLVTMLWAVSLLYLILGRFFLAKLFFADERCTGCGQCAKACPWQVITMRGGKGQGTARNQAAHALPFWSIRCESCMRCMAYCPEQAIQAGHSWAVVLGLVTSAGALSLLLQNVLPDNWLAQIQPALHIVSDSGIGAVILGLLVQYAWFLVALVVAYRVFWLLIRVRWINRLFTWTTLTRCYRRYHEPDTPLDELRADE